MKTIRRKRVTIREKESVVIKTTVPQNDPHLCPFCNAPIDFARFPAKFLKEDPKDTNKAEQ